MKKDEYYQSLTVALDQLTRFEPVISDQATRTPWSGFLRKQPVLHEDTNKILEMEKRVNSLIILVFVMMKKKNKMVLFFKP